MICDGPCHLDQPEESFPFRGAGSTSGPRQPICRRCARVLYSRAYHARKPKKPRKPRRTRTESADAAYVQTPRCVLHDLSLTADGCIYCGPQRATDQELHEAMAPRYDADPGPAPVLDYGSDTHDFQQKVRAFVIPGPKAPFQIWPKGKTNA